ncbi:Rho-type gtpase-activating protein [Exophiala dermatitidis]|uniref:Rho-type gtpase-activating protein n=1 Tax=Exophiala dermatitidis TaxID=5970 RepID=A0AAN6IXR1_EXODE|nr:Rho-type gtpase-activating protein [Exophiala dermatitidis]KAJ4527276.1 Rho-type gtpase-activating protein [Exophiala dermatitidis]KAJ4530829.1 Rho-type gtpase-activating protein [Exophiala dermatitidis]KAJ4558001.1 Rho-type gtpase-activating protein [Exophiala dermatitidis]KAJ4581970.1 Rho-type gtpase-activating protein [Exophiala dermatitidis]
MATALESPAPFPESPLDPDDIPFPCKGCGQILEEGKAFELAGNRWHIDCFRCNTCGTALDSDANLLLLGDGSLICNNCTYSCSSCGNKIEDLAILTGDQAFCANCFKCRNCKRKIENLRYARTSQGIFCMDCHEALMARRRKRTAKNNSQRSKLSANNSVQLDKSLPAIPPPEARKTAYVPEDHSPYPEGYVEAPADLPSVAKTMSELRGDDDSRPSSSDQNPPRDMLTLPSTTFKNNRHSMMSQRSDLTGGGGEEFLIPLAFDPTPQPSTQSPSVSSQATPRQVDEKPRDYFSSRPAPATTKSSTSSPHIAYQEKGRQPSRDLVERSRSGGNVSRNGSAHASPYTSVDRSSKLMGDSPRLSQTARPNDGSLNEKFKLQDAPKSKKAVASAANSRSGTSTPQADVASESPSPTEQPATTKAAAMETASPSDRGFSTPQISRESSPQSEAEESPKPAQLPAASVLQNLPKRGDSLESAKRAQTIPRKDLSSSANIPSSLSSAVNGTPVVPLSSSLSTDLARANGGKIISGPIGSPSSRSIFDTADDSLNQGDLPSAGRAGNESFVDPRAPPLPPADHSRSRNESFSTMQSENQRYLESQKALGLPRYSTGGEFSMDEDMARIMAGDEPSAHGSFLKRVSNSVRHGRSYSDKTGRLSRDRWPRSPAALPTTSIGQEISSPSSASPEHRDELSWFKNELRRERQKIIEREKRIAELEAQLDSAADIKQVNSELKEKRSTIVVLDTQKEIVVRELEVLTEHLAVAKRSGEPFDVNKLRGTVLREFAEALEKLKNSFAPQIEESIQRRNDLVDEIANLTQMKDKSFMEFEQLSSKNAQLAELNNQLVHQIQGLYKANSGVQPEAPKAAINGLGIYSHHKEKSNLSFDSREAVARNMSTDLTNIESASTLQASEAEPVTVIQGPQMVNIRKGQPKKFDWRRGQKVAKGVTKGLKGAFSSTQQTYSRDLQFAETGAYGSGPVGQEYGSMPKTNPEPVKQGGFGFFGNQKTATKPNGLYAQQANASTPSLLVDATTQLFGSDLEQRAEFEKTSVPSIVVRCIEEVEARGMDVEGIYRKSGANSQVQQVKEWFENPTKDFDISDPDFDIHAVTSGLKQYFRRLPVPLITYDVYDKLLETTTITEREARIDAMERALEELPRIHYETLTYLMQHLARVVQQEKVNLMTSMNIAVVFAPTIMRSENINRELSDTKTKNEAVMWMVEHSDRIFGT